MYSCIACFMWGHRAANHLQRSAIRPLPHTLIMLIGCPFWLAVSLLGPPTRRPGAHGYFWRLRFRSLTTSSCAYQGTECYHLFYVWPPGHVSSRRVIPELVSHNVQKNCRVTQQLFKHTLFFHPFFERADVFTGPNRVYFPLGGILKVWVENW